MIPTLSTVSSVWNLTLNINGYPDNHKEVSLKVHGSKNCALPIVMYNFLLEWENKIVLDNIPNISDILHAVDALRKMGGKATYFPKKEQLVIYSGITTDTIPETFIANTRISVLLMSIVVRKFWKVMFPKMVGWCALGGRQLDYHLEAFKVMGCDIIESTTMYTITLTNRDKKNIVVTFPQPSTTGTENIIILAECLTHGIILKNAHLRPEIMEFIEYINKTGTKNIFIDWESLLITAKTLPLTSIRVTHRIIDDLEELISKVALLIASWCNGEVSFNNSYRYAEIEKLFDLASKIVFRSKTGFRVKHSSSFKKHSHIEIVTGPYPQIWSDNQPIFAGFLPVLADSFTITDTRFTARFQYAEHLQQYGCAMYVKDNQLTVSSTKMDEERSGKAQILIWHDLRSSMNAILIASCFWEKTEVRNAHLLLRGYADLFYDLEELGFDISFKQIYD